MANRLDRKAFELSKSGSSTSTTVSLLPIDEEDLSDAELKNFEVTAGKAFPEELYEKVLFVKSEADQINDLKAFGFDVSKLGINSDEDEVTPIEQEDPTAGF
jgi:hypothetical protein